MKLKAGKRLGRYEIVDPLGAGGMGEVYRARDRRLGREVAIKVLPGQVAADDDRLKRFEREARAASLINHPNVLVIFDIGTEDGLPFLVTELLEGESLRDALTRGERFDLVRSLRDATRLAAGLAAAHDQGIVHRDLKPENVYLLHDGRLKILDFGLAKLRIELGTAGSGAVLSHAGRPLTTAGQRLTVTGMLMGTVGYMSPEQAAEREVDYRADQFALGVVLYEMLTGQRPFHRPTQVQTLAAVIEAEPHPITSYDFEVPPELAAVIDRLLAKSPDERYRSTHDLVDDLVTIASTLDTLTPSPPDAVWGHDASTLVESPEFGGNRCPRCTHRNDASSRFCGRCGAALAPPAGRRCTSCGHHSSGSTSFCDHCGHRLSDPAIADVPVSTTLPMSPPPARTPSDPLAPGERRQATVGTAFLGGYSDLVEHLAPAEVDDVIDRLRVLAAEIVEREGGRVHRFTGEEMVVVFGIPTAHEDDFVRAVTALRDLHGRVGELGAEIERRTGRAIALHTGIDTGWIVTQLLDGSERFSVTGEALRCASALANRADAGEILVGPETRRLIAPFFDTDPGERLPLTGLSRPLVSHRVVAPSHGGGRLETDPNLSLVPLVGRERELDGLHAALEKARSGEGQLVCVVGEAGSGKTRLLYEFGRAVEGARVVQGRCQAAATPYLPFAEALRGCLGGIPAGASAEEAEARILAVDPDLEHLVPFYLRVLEIPSDAHPMPEHYAGRHLERVLAETLAVAFTACAEHEPLVLLLENWQRSDEGSRTVLQQLLEISPAHRLLVVVSHRSRHTFDWGPVPRSSIELGGLTLDGAGAVLAAVAGVDDFPRDLAERLHDKTGGNPFFLEETCRGMLETGRLEVQRGRAKLRGSADDLELPATVQAVIRSRLDRLDPETREVLRRASVIGREFSRGLLERTSPDPAQTVRGLEALRELGLVQQTRVLPEPVYRFQHALTRDVAYESLLQHQRRSLHALVGEAYEESDEGGDHAEVLAEHFGRAQSWAKAVRYGLEAASRADRRSLYSESLQLLEKTRRWIARLGDAEERKRHLVDVLLRQERLCETLGAPERQKRLLDRLTKLLDAESDGAELAEVCRRRGELATIRGRYGDAQNALSEALRLSRDAGDPLAERNAWRSIGFLRWHQERHGEALEANRAALDIDRRLDDFEAVAVDLMNIGSVERSLGAHDEARQHLGEALEIFEKLEDLAHQVETLHLIAVSYRDQGRNTEALEYLDRAQGLSDSPVRRFFQLTMVGNIHLENGRVEDGLECFREAVESCRNARYAHGLSRSLLALGEALAALERHAEAAPCLREGAEAFERLGDRENAVSMWTRWAQSCERLGDADGAFEAWHRISTYRRAARDAAGELAAVEGMAKASRARDSEPTAAKHYFETALALARRLGEADKAGELLNTLGILEWSRGNYEEALKRYAEALHYYRGQGDEVHAGLILNSMGVTLRDLGWHEEAVSHLEEAVEVNRKTGERLLLGHSLAVLGEIRFDRGDVAGARALFEESLALRREIDDANGEGWMRYQLARVHAAEGSAEAPEWLESALEKAAATGDLKLRQACRELRSGQGAEHDSSSC